MPALAVRLTSFVALLATLLGCAASSQAKLLANGIENSTAAAPASEPQRILLFTRTTGFRHDSIPEAVRAVRELAQARGLEVEHTEDPTQFTAPNLKRFRVIAFLNTSGDVLPEREQEQAFEQWLESGGRFLGVHAATDTEFNWPWYGRMIGAYFAGHPRIQPAVQVVVDPTHPATAHLPARWLRTDEWYNFRSFEPDIKVILRLDTSTYQGSRHGETHASAWCKPVGKGKMFYTAGGHTKESYAEPEFRAHLAGALQWLLDSAALTPSPGGR